MCGRGRAGAQQERTAQYGGRMFVFATTQGVQGDMPSAIARALGENPKSRVAPCKTQCKCTCRRGSGPSAPARARFMGLIGCIRVLCRAESCSPGMPDDNYEARALCARRQCSRAAGSQ